MEGEEAEKKGSITYMGSQGLCLTSDMSPQFFALDPHCHLDRPLRQEREKGSSCCIFCTIVIHTHPLTVIATANGDGGGGGAMAVFFLFFVVDSQCAVMFFRSR